MNDPNSSYIGQRLHRIEVRRQTVGMPPKQQSQVGRARIEHMGLHVQTTPATVDRDRPPLPLVHGAWHASWCWTEYWTDYLAERGYTSHALDLRGHGRSPGSLRRSGIGDYVADVRTVAASLDEPPVIVGHSMGGFVTQHYLSRFRARAGVLVASVPNHGVMPATIRVAREHPGAFARANATLNLGPIVDDPVRAKALLFGSHTPDEYARRYIDQVQGESYLAFIGMMFSRPKPAQVRDPLFIIGAAEDAIFPPREIHDTAEDYGTTATIFEGIGHDMMLDTRWEEPAAAVTDFLDTL
ncbi:MAG: alpha/beta fold hydrolase [Armatimonadetes bacterium]|nr:MAG: alpha/beta fold hydrolase [Armatimonadota bacterium]